MNREIKFRAWDDNLEVIFDWEYVMIDKDGTWIKSEPTKSSLDNNLILMQYTGLKDKNGVEIYEGDIVNYSDGLGFVGYFEPYAGFGVYDDTDARCPEDVYHNDLHITDWINYRAEHIEVIGNIYENPELLESTP